MSQVWIVDDDQSIRWVLQKALTRASVDCRSFATGDDALVALDDAVPLVLVTDIRMPGRNGLDLLQQVKTRCPGLAVIVMTAYSDLDSTVAAFQKGAFDYLVKPFDVNAAVALIQRALDESAQKEAVYVHTEVDSTAEHGASATARAVDSSMRELSAFGLVPGGFGQVLPQHSVTTDVGSVPAGKRSTPVMMQSSSSAMQDVFRAIGRLSASSASVLITGESGTGKELVARALHDHGVRAKRPFIALNAAAISRDLLEAELFGHERGAFTGATQLRQGCFEAADGGTLFLDEIGDMPADLQSRLLRVLAQGSFYRVGGTRAINVDVRIVAATHQPLEQRVADRLFREDLYHRLNVIRLRLPTLRERKEDIPALAQQFLKSSASDLGVSPRDLSPAAWQVLVDFDYPGNIRQLENICHWITVMSASRAVDVKDLPPEVLESVAAPFASPLIDIQAAKPTDTNSGWMTSLNANVDARLAMHEPALMASLRREFEQTVLSAALRHSQGHRAEAAQRLGIGRNTFTRKYAALIGNAQEQTPDR